MDKDAVLRLTLGDWQWNAAIIGFINIVGEENVRFAKNTLEFSAELLEEFEEKYFAYFIHTYEKMLSWYKIVAFRAALEAYENGEFENFNLHTLENLNKYIKDVKRFIKSNSYQAAYELIASNVDMLDLEKKLTTIKEPKDERRFEVDKLKIITEARERFVLLRQVIDYCGSPQGKRYIGAKNVIDMVISNAWSGVSFLNAQTKEKDVYTDYEEYFVDGTIAYLQQDKNKYKYTCFVCGAPIKDLEHDLSFLNATGFDVARKSSHVWNFQNDIAICPLCKLVYSCLPAGMTYVYDRGLYVNANMNLRMALEINRKIQYEVLHAHQGPSIRSLYPVLVGALHEKEHDAVKYELADIQVVRYKHKIIRGSRGNKKVVNYQFNILSRKMLEIIVECQKDLDSLLKAVLVENEENIRIYDEVVARIFNNQNLFTLIHRMLYHKLANPDKCYFHGTHVSHALKINGQIYKRLGGMKMEREGYQKGSAGLIWAAKTAGQNLKDRYYRKGAEHKLSGICYRLLNALKTSNEEMFLDVTLNCYLYVGAPVPDVITKVLGNEKDFSTMGYAFVAALIDGPQEKENAADGEESV